MIVTYYYQSGREANKLLFLRFFLRKILFGVKTL